MPSAGWPSVHLIQPQLVLNIRCLSRWESGKRAPAGLHQTSASAGDTAGWPNGFSTALQSSILWMGYAPAVRTVSPRTCSCSWSSGAFPGMQAALSPVGAPPKPLARRQPHTLQPPITDHPQALARIAASAGFPAALPRSHRWSSGSPQLPNSHRELIQHVPAGGPSRPTCWPGSWPRRCARRCSSAGGACRPRWRGCRRA